jgi:hypothetical protein
MDWAVLEDNYIISLLETVYDENDSKLVYVKEKLKRRGVEYLTLMEYNYIRKKNDLPQISIQNIEKLLFETVITYTDINKATGISRPMLSMILRETRNTTVLALRKICNCISSKNPKVNKESILE